MVSKSIVTRCVGTVFAMGSLMAMAGSALATLHFHYDPTTGNVSLDTSNTRTGAVQIFGFRLNPHASDIRFRQENHLTITGSFIFDSSALTLSDGTLGQPPSGYFTIGDVLPPGLTEETWTSLFSGAFFPNGIYTDASQGLGDHHYIDGIGIGLPEPAQFFYGKLDREYDNRWDLVDPDTLDWAAQATLIYREATGEVVLDTSTGNGGHITGFLLTSEGQFLPNGYNSFPNLPLQEATSDIVSAFADALEPGMYSLGNILPAHLTSRELEETFLEATFIARAGFGSNTLAIETDGIALTLRYQAVPEPKTLMLAVLGCALIARSRLASQAK